MAQPAVRTKDGNIREVPMIKPSQVQIVALGNKRWADIRLPPTFTLADVTEHPEVWRTVQENMPTALMKDDEVKLKESDDRWRAYTTVAAANRVSVWFTKPHKVDMPEISMPSFEDESYRTDYRQGAYQVVRKSDGIVMGNRSFHTIEQARQFIATLSPTYT